MSLLEGAGFEVRDVRSLREHYWRLYLVASPVAFEAGQIAVHQVLTVCSDAGRSGMPLVREQWLASAI